MTRRRLILSLCDHTGNWSRPYADDPAYEVMRIDLLDGTCASSRTSVARSTAYWRLLHALIFLRRKACALGEKRARKQ